VLLRLLQERLQPWCFPLQEHRDWGRSYNTPRQSRQGRLDLPVDAG